MFTRLVELTDVINLLIAEGELKSDKPVPAIAITHGACCTCQDCGYTHDDCVCYSNELLEKLNNLQNFLHD